MSLKLLGRTSQEYIALGAGHTASEICQQGKLWCQTIENLSKQKPALQNFLKQVLQPSTKIIFTGAGTSEFVGNTIAPYLQALGNKHVYSISSTDIVLAPEAYIHSNDKILLVSCARSGNSPESLGAAKLVEKIARTCHHLILACDPNGNLTQHYQKASNSYIFHLEGANDQGFAMTSSFTCMTLASALIFQLAQLELFSQNLNLWINNVDTYIEALEPQITALAALQKKRVICLGSAENKGIAQEAHLKVLELSASHNVATYDSPLGFRHGPKSVLSDESIVFVFCSGNAYTSQYELDLLKELMETDGSHHVVALSPAVSKFAANTELYCHTFIEHPKVSEVFEEQPGKQILNSLLHILTAQIYALQNSLNLGVQPDNPSPSGSVNRVVQGVHLYQYQDIS